VTSTPRTSLKDHDTSALDRRRNKAQAAKDAADRAQANVAELDARLSALTTQTQQDQSALQRAQDEVTRLKRAVKAAAKEGATLQARRKKASAAVLKSQAKAQAAEARYDEAVLAEIVRREKDRDRAAASTAKPEQPAETEQPAAKTEQPAKSEQPAAKTEQPAAKTEQPATSEQPAAVPAPGTSHDDANKDAQNAS
jgi:chromosome segregation ATPase